VSLTLLDLQVQILRMSGLEYVVKPVLGLFTDPHAEAGRWWAHVVPELARQSWLHRKNEAPSRQPRLERGKGAAGAHGQRPEAGARDNGQRSPHQRLGCRKHRANAARLLLFSRPAACLGEWLSAISGQGKRKDLRHGINWATLVATSDRSQASGSTMGWPPRPMAEQQWSSADCSHFTALLADSCPARRRMVIWRYSGTGGRPQQGEVRY
jgi:hypothetical protein